MPLISSPRTYAASPVRGLFSAASIVLLAGAAEAQQFTAQTLPGGSVWSEGVSAADIDLDGDLDLLIANGDGFSTAGAKRQNTILVNQLVEQGSLSFVDESVARLGVQRSNAKQVIAGDVNGDGYPDLLYANAFNTDPPFLYINRGAAEPGVFDLDSAARGLTQVLSSAGAQFGDVDDDGDLDLVISDSGSSFFGGSGAVPRLYLNDGAGFFTDASTQLNTTAKRAQMDVNLVDMDNDWDIDVVLTNRASNAGGTHYLLLNDGTGTFTDASTLLPNTSASVYEAEMGDLDGDLDRDLFFLSLNGFQEGTVRNNLAETGSLAFSIGALETGSVDDNEVALFDYDTDGDFDVLVGSLGSRERLYRNDGGLNLVPNNAVVQGVGDSTLDLTVADFDNDGDYDFVTVQGESGSFINRLYTNAGSADDRAPVVLAVNAPATPSTWPVKIQSRVRDQVMDDGETYVSVEALYARVPATVESVTVTPSGFAPAQLTLAAGTRVRFVAASGVTGTVTGLGVSAWQRAFDVSGVAQREFVAAIDHTVTATGVAGACQITVMQGAASVASTHSGNALFRAAVPQLAAGPTSEFAYVIAAKDWAGNVGYSDSGSIQDPTTVGTPYCQPIVNSSGDQARIVLRGSGVLSDQSATLEAWALPTTSFGFFLASRTQDAQPVGQGTFCLGQPFGRFSNFVQNSGATGQVSLPMPFSALPPSVAFLAGDTWNFTYWFRDANPTVGANFSDGVELTWQ